MEDQRILRNRKEFHAKLREFHLREGYDYDDNGKFATRPYWPLEPRNKVAPHLWPWKEIRKLVLDSGDMVGLGRGNSLILDTLEDLIFDLFRGPVFFC